MSDSESSVSSKPPSPKLQLSLDFRIVTIILLVIIIAMLALWRPWTTRTQDQTRTVSVSGEAKVTSTPDEFVFSPQYDFQNADKAAALSELTAKQATIVSALKKLGVTDTQIAADSNGGDYGYYFDDTTNTSNYTLSLTVTLTDKSLTQKVQDYLVTTSPTGSVSPSSDFSDAKRKQLESQGRDEATKDARTKAEQSATNLGFKIVKVKSISDGTNGGGTVQPLASDPTSFNVAGGDIKQSLAVQPGQDQLDYSVNVVYYID